MLPLSPMPAPLWVLSPSPLVCSIIPLLKLSSLFSCIVIFISTGSNTSIYKHVPIFPKMSQKYDLFHFFLFHEFSLPPPISAKLLKWILCIIPNSSLFLKNEQQQYSKTSSIRFPLYRPLLQKSPCHGHKITSLWYIWWDAPSPHLACSTSHRWSLIVLEIPFSLSLCSLPTSQEAPFQCLSLIIPHPTDC